MADNYRIIGAEMSPYSVKVRSYFRYRAIPHQWILRSAASQAEFEKYARMPIIPLVVTPEGTGIQDSTPIIEAMEKLHPVPSIHPGDPVAGFISALIEEFGDEWGNKWMFHYRWAREVDQISSAGRLARMRAPNARAEQREEFSATLAEKVWTQKPQKYHARSLGMLRAKYAAVADKAALDPVLEAAGCLAGLRN